MVRLLSPYEGKTSFLSHGNQKIDMTESVIKVTEFRSIRSMMRKARERAIAYGMDAEEVNNWTRGKIIAEMFDSTTEQPGLLDGPVFAW